MSATTTDDRVQAGPSALEARILELETANRTLATRNVMLEAKRDQAFQVISRCEAAQATGERIPQQEFQRAGKYFFDGSAFDPDFLPWPKE